MTGARRSQCKRRDAWPRYEGRPAWRYGGQAGVGFEPGRPTRPVARPRLCGWRGRSWHINMFWWNDSRRQLGPAAEKVTVTSAARVLEYVFISICLCLTGASSRLDQVERNLYAQGSRRACHTDHGSWRLVKDHKAQGTARSLVKSHGALVTRYGALIGDSLIRRSTSHGPQGTCHGSQIIVQW